jgi:hypothetical protein
MAFASFGSALSFRWYSKNGYSIVVLNCSDVLAPKCRSPRVSPAPRLQPPGLPEFVVRAVLHHRVPEFDFALVVLRVRVLERAHFEEELVAVRRAVVEGYAVSLLDRPGPFDAEGVQEVEGVRQEQAAVVVEVVADEPVVDRGLRR